MLTRAAKTTDWRAPNAIAASAFDEIRMVGLGKTVEPSVDEETLNFLIVPAEVGASSAREACAPSRASHLSLRETGEEPTDVSEERAVQF